MIINRPIPHGQERLATERERDDVSRRIAARALENRTGPIGRVAERPTRIGAGDDVNRFLLCAVVKESSRQIRARTRSAGTAFPMSTIVRGVLRCYRRAATDRDSPLADATFDIAGLRRLNERVLRDETRRLALERVGTSQASLARAERLGDDSRIKVERAELDLAIETKEALFGDR